VRPRPPRDPDVHKWRLSLAIQPTSMPFASRKLSESYVYEYPASIMAPGGRPPNDPSGAASSRVSVRMTPALRTKLDQCVKLYRERSGTPMTPSRMIMTMIQRATEPLLREWATAPRRPQATYAPAGRARGRPRRDPSGAASRVLSVRMTPTARTQLERHAHRYRVSSGSRATAPHMILVMIANVTPQLLGNWIALQRLEDAR